MLHTVTKAAVYMVAGLFGSLFFEITFLINDLGNLGAPRHRVGIQSGEKCLGRTKMNRQFAIALLSLTLVGAAVAQKTNGILVEVDSSRLGDENSANGKITDGSGQVPLWLKLLKLRPGKPMFLPAKRQRKTAALEVLTDGYPTTHATS